MYKTITGFRLLALAAAVYFMPSPAFAWDPYEADLYGRYTLTASSSGAIAPGGDAVTIARLGNNVVYVKLSPAGDNSVKAELSIYSEQSGSGGNTLKLVARPVIVGLVGRPMEIAIGGADGQPGLKFQITPLLKTGNYAGPQLSDEALAKTDAVMAGVLDVEAMYWAWCIAEKGDAQYDEAVNYSATWDIFPATRERFWLKTGELIASGQARKLTGDEKRRMKAAGRRLAELTAGEPRYDRALKQRITAVDEVMGGVAGLDAMYWAWRIAHDKDVTYAGLRESSKNWVASRAQNERFFGAMKEILDAGRARQLTPEEGQAYEAAIEKARTAGR